MQIWLKDTLALISLVALAWLGVMWMALLDMA